MHKILPVALGLLILFCFFGCSEESNPLPSKSHPDEWNTASSASFHGKKVLTSGKASCTGCHGYELAGTASAPACQSCHSLYPHSEQWMVIADREFHGAYIAGDHWSMASCKKCHGDDYAGGSSGASCTSCHPGENGPESCATCHGSLKNPAPPEDLQGHVSTSSMGVGAHQLHVDGYGRCDICHLVPASVSDPDHIDQSEHAEVLAKRNWNRATGTCVTGCHTSTDKSYIWNSF